MITDKDLLGEQQKQNREYMKITAIQAIEVLARFEKSCKDFESRIIKGRLKHGTSFDTCFDLLPSFGICNFLFRELGHLFTDLEINELRQDMFNYLLKIKPSNNSNLIFANSPWFKTNEERIYFVTSYINYLSEGL